MRCCRWAVRPTPGAWLDFPTSSCSSRSGKVRSILTVSFPRGRLVRSLTYTYHQRQLESRFAATSTPRYASSARSPRQPPGRLRTHDSSGYRHEKRATLGMRQCSELPRGARDQGLPRVRIDNIRLLRRRLPGMVLGRGQRKSRFLARWRCSLPFKGRHLTQSFLQCCYSMDGVTSRYRFNLCREDVVVRLLNLLDRLEQHAQELRQRSRTRGPSCSNARAPTRRTAARHCPGRPMRSWASMLCGLGNGRWTIRTGTFRIRGVRVRTIWTIGRITRIVVD